MSANRRIGHRHSPPAPPRAFPSPLLAPLHRVNVYTCKDCKKRLITIDRHVGVTPFMMRCDPERTKDGCGGWMYSAMYRVEPAEAWATLATHEWFTPTESERQQWANDPAMLHHLEQGGLDFRQIDRRLLSREATTRLPVRNS